MYVFGDGFDLYATLNDALLGYWDSGSVSNLSISSGRFVGSQGVQLGNNSGLIYLTKSSGVNDAVHHVTIAFRQTATLTGSNLTFGINLIDGTTTQCSIVFRSDGAILLTSGATTGTVLATYNNAVSTQNVWFAFEFEVVIHNVTGSFTVRKNGNLNNDFFQPSLPTRGGTSNNYANKLQLGMSTGPVTSQFIDDLLWRSDASTVSWVGDIRCNTRMPASDANVQFSKSQTLALTQTFPTSAPYNTTISAATFTAFIAAYSGVVTSVGIPIIGLGSAVNMKCVIYADNGLSGPGVVLASASNIVNPIIVATNVFTFAGVSVTKGTQYWTATLTDGTITYPCDIFSSYSVTQTVAYATFPQSNPVVTTSSYVAQRSWTYSSSPANWQAVAEPQQDGTASYVYDSTMGHADFYNIASLGSTPSSVVAVTVRGFMEKSDAGSRSGTVQLKSGVTTVAAPTLALATNFLWVWRTDTLDPNTGTVWTPSAVNTMQIGPLVVT